MSKTMSQAIGKGWRDIELLGALTSNDSSRFNRVIARLESEARQIANELLNGENIEEAVSKARDKVIDWMRSDAPFKVSHPMAYAKSLAHNAIVDYARTNKGRAIPENQIKEDLAWIDEGMGYFSEGEEGDVQTTTGGWHGVKVNQKYLGRDFQKLPAIHYPEHSWLRALGAGSLGKCVGWLLPYSWSAYDYLFNKFRGTGDRVKPGMVSKLLKSERDKRWQRYKRIVALINEIPGLREQEIIRYYFYGFSVTNIAVEFSVTKPYVSKVIRKWLSSWGWDKLQVERDRIIFLTHYLATAYSKVAARIVQKKQPSYRPLHSDKRVADILYRNIIKATETKAYFSDLRESDNLALLEVCSTCRDYW